jgi:hypothetical protein
MRKEVWKNKAELQLKEASCGWCGKRIYDGYKKIMGIDGLLFEIRGVFGSEHDLMKFKFEICDKCFDKILKKKASEVKGIIRI